MDFFHRQDADGDGKVTRKQFIEGIIKTRTSDILSTATQCCDIGEVFVMVLVMYCTSREFIYTEKLIRQAVCIVQKFAWFNDKC